MAVALHSLALSRIIYRSALSLRTTTTISHFRMVWISRMRVRNVGQTAACFSSLVLIGRGVTQIQVYDAISRSEMESVPSLTRGRRFVGYLFEGLRVNRSSRKSLIDSSRVPCTLVSNAVISRIRQSGAFYNMHGSVLPSPATLQLIDTR